MINFPPKKNGKNQMAGKLPEPLCKNWIFGTVKPTLILEDFLLRQEEEQFSNMFCKG